MLSPDENIALIEYVSELLTMAAMTMYTNSMMTDEHKHRQIGETVLCVHEFVAPNGRTVRLFVNHSTPRSLTLSITVGDDEVMGGPPIDYKELHDQAVIETLEHILDLPDAEEPTL